MYFLMYTVSMVGHVGTLCCSLAEECVRCLTQSSSVHGWAGDGWFIPHCFKAIAGCAAQVSSTAGRSWQEQQNPSVLRCWGGFPPAGPGEVPIPQE